jgi:hypothetical protein
VRHRAGERLRGIRGKTTEREKDLGNILYALTGRKQRKRHRTIHGGRQRGIKKGRDRGEEHRWRGRGRGE